MDLTKPVHPAYAPLSCKGNRDDRSRSMRKCQDYHEKNMLSLLLAVGLDFTVLKRQGLIPMVTCLPQYRTRTRNQYYVNKLDLLYLRFRAPCFLLAPSDIVPDVSSSSCSSLSALPESSEESSKACFVLRWATRAVMCRETSTSPNIKNLWRIILNNPTLHIANASRAHILSPKAGSL
jgi:hypothetical protein